MIRCTVIVATSVALLSPVAAAQITQEDDLVFGVGAITRDASQGLDFLDLPLSTNRSFADVSSQFGVGGDFEGWRHASPSELTGLVNSWGLTPGMAVTPASVSSEVFTGTGDQLPGLIALLGATNTSINASQSIGVVDQTLTFAPNVVRRYRITDLLDTLEDDNVSAVQYGTAQSSASVGHFLVRDVPGPGGLALFGLVVARTTRRRRTVSC